MHERDGDPIVFKLFLNMLFIARKPLRGAIPGGDPVGIPPQGACLAGPGLEQHLPARPDGMHIGEFNDPVRALSEPKCVAFLVRLGWRKPGRGAKLRNNGQGEER